MTILVCFRNDLRLTDNPALSAAVASGDKVLPVFIHAPDEFAPWSPGQASNWWLHQSLTELMTSIKKLGSRLIVRQGPTLLTLRKLCRETGASSIYWNRRYEPAAIKIDKKVKAALQKDAVEVKTFNANLVNEPWEVLKQDGTPYKVFTAYWRACQRQYQDVFPLPAPAQLPRVSTRIRSVPLKELGLLPTIKWYQEIAATWQPGEQGASALLHGFVQAALAEYPHARDIPGINGTSRLSPHLHFGEMSPRQLLAGLAAFNDIPGTHSGYEAYVRQIYWREFASYLLYHFPHTPNEPLDVKFNKFPWRRKPSWLKAWQQGETGYPIIDAGMRELWQTGWMHNRVRMIVASFLTKHLTMHWQHGARWFWDTLVDADLANNTMGWQWVAGCGADAAPYFRVFNPLTQAQKFDPEGDYVRQWIPELRHLDSSIIHTPWQHMPSPGTYPKPLIDLAVGRQQALDAYSAMRQKKLTIPNS